MALGCTRAIGASQQAASPVPALVQSTSVPQLSQLYLLPNWFGTSHRLLLE